MARFDIAPARYQGKGPMVLDFRNGQPGLVAVVDGVGWGTGMEAASWVRDLLSAQWQRKIPADAAVVSADLELAASSIPEELLDGEFGHDFSIDRDQARDDQFFRMTARSEAREGNQFLQALFHETEGSRQKAVSSRTKSVRCLLPSAYCLLASSGEILKVFDAG